MAISGNQAESKLHELGKTPINFENLRQLIGNYPNKDDAEILFSGFKFGLKINYYGGGRFFPNDTYRR
jgi:hypothetical protein